MTATTSGGIAGKGTFARGVHPPEGKQFAEHQSIEVLPTPEQVLIPLQQHIGAPCTPVFEKPRQEVAWGDVLGEAGGFVSAPVHSPIAGQTAMLSVATLPNGRHVKAVPVKAGEEQPSDDQIRADVLGGDWPVTGLDTHAPEAIVSAVQSAGLVGMGGAAFPTHVKLTRNEAKPVDTLLLNGCECEPYLTADHRVMVEATSAVVCGALLAARAAGADNIIIAIESNKPDAVDALKQAADGTGITVAMVETKYPMGGERQTVLAVLGREVPTGGLPLDVGVVVMNVGTAAAVARAVLRGKPLTHRVVTVSGAGIRQPKNLLVPIGVSYGELIDACGGLTADAARVVAGGPMMGFTISQMNTPVTKGTSGLTVLTEADVRQAEETSCVRCGRCVDVCPLNLVPTKMALASRHKDWDLAKQYHLPACCECGCCAYICPARLPLVQLMRMGKAQMPR